ncbi:hypothetical protein [Kitasatospora cinereorecta]|uniref:Uncharacterized protein n=1 Tax=Kitasatospora cinereorecta TaxID=285560 RepID=A0ABW0VI64_9ACTN
MSTLGTGTWQLPEVPPLYLSRAAWLAAVLPPLALVGLAVSATDPDFRMPGAVAELLVLAVGLILLLVLRAGWRRVLLGGICGIVLLAVPGGIFADEVMKHRGLTTEVVVTAARPPTGLIGDRYWTCDIRRTDGRPLPHAVLTDGDCLGQDQVGSTESVLVDPAGWVAPTSADPGNWGYDGEGLGLIITAAAGAVWGWLAVTASQRPGSAVGHDQGLSQ